MSTIITQDGAGVKLRPEVDDHKIPVMPMRETLYRSLKQRGAQWADDVDVELYDGLLRITHKWHRYKKWATQDSGAIGELGFAVTKDGVEHIVWRSAFANPVGNRDADDNEPWRKAESPGQALGLLLESVWRQLQPNEPYRAYEAGIGQPHPDNRKRRLEQYIMRLSRQVYHCMRHSNSVRVLTNEDRSFYDPATGGAAKAAAGQHEPKWQGDMYHTEPMEMDSKTIAGRLKGTYITAWYPEQRWDLSYLRKRSIAVFVCHSAREYAIAYGSGIPEYVKPAVEFTRGRIVWVPQLNKANEAAYHAAVNSHLSRTTMPDPVMTYRLTDPPKHFNSNMNILLDPRG